MSKRGAFVSHCVELLKAPRKEWTSGTCLVGMKIRRSVYSVFIKCCCGGRVERNAELTEVDDGQI